MASRKVAVLAQNIKNKTNYTYSCLQFQSRQAPFHLMVTGGNKGIGLAIVKGLCEKFDGDVYLTARDSGRGQAAVEELKALGYNPLFHQLDTTDQKSVDTFRDYLKSKHGGVDVLINNAAIASWRNSTEPAQVVAKATIDTNYYGSLKVCNALFPLLRQNGRVVNVSSVAGHLSNIQSADLKAKFTKKTITIDELNKLIDAYVQAEGTPDSWNVRAYVISKVGLSCLTKIQQRLFDAEKPNRNISANSVHPGYIDTDLVREITKEVPGAGTVEEGARAPLFLALESDFKGEFVWKDCTLVDWEATKLAEKW